MRRGNRDLWLRIVALAAVGALAFAACGDPDVDEPGGQPSPTEDHAEDVTTIEEGVLTVGSDIPYPPFEFRRGGELVGLDIDVMNAIAQHLELEPKYVDTSFDTIFTQLQGGRFDAVIAASTITPEREDQVNFSEPYYKAQQSLTVNVNETPDIESTDDLSEGDTVGVQNGTTGKTWAEENLAEGIEIRAFPEGPDAYAALEAGQLTGVINDEPTAIAEVEAREGLELVETIETGEFYGIAVNPENEALLDAINEALATMIEDGTYEEIYSKYPDLPPGGNIAAE